MKVTRIASALLLLSLFWSCGKDDESPAPGPIYEGNNATFTGGLSNLRIKNLSGTVHLDPAATQGKLRVEAGSSLTNALVFTQRNGELKIEGNHNLPANMQLGFYLHPNDLNRLVLEGNNTVNIGSSAVLDDLELVTEGESELTFQQMQVKSLVSRTEGKSQMTLSSQIPYPASNTVAYPAAGVTLVDSKHLIFTENNQQFLLAANQITVNGDSIYASTTASSQPLKAYFLSQTHTLSSKAESVLNTVRMPALTVTCQTEGKSESRIWAVNTLTVKGGGESRIYLKGSPEISQTMTGSAFLVHVP